MIHSFEIEKQVLSGMIKIPEFYHEVSSFVEERDFCNKAELHKILFNVIKGLYDHNKSVDPVLVSQRVAALKINSRDKVDVGEYVGALALRAITIDSALEAAKELKLLSAKRMLHDAGSKLQKAMGDLPPEASFGDIVAAADKIYNEHVNFASCEADEPTNIYERLPELIEDLGDGKNIVEGPMGPYPMVNKIFGSLLIPGNITTVVARAGVGKTSLALDYTTWVSAEHDIPVLHFDNGEMSENELIIRQTAALSGVPMYLIQSGKWRHAGDEIVEKVRSVYKTVENLKFYYYNVAGKTPEEMVNVLKRTYFKRVKRGEKLIFSFDYIKATTGGNKDVWLNVGTMMDRFKQCIQKELVFDKKPVVALFTSVQANRSGIVGRRNSGEVIDDESIAALSDMIIQITSHFFILRKKTHDEILDEGGEFGTHIFLGKKARSLGEDIYGYLSPVKVNDVLRDNHINLEFENFSITEKGDLRDFVKYLEEGGGGMRAEDVMEEAPQQPRRGQGTMELPF